MFFRNTTKVFPKYKCFSLIVLNNEHLCPRQRESRVNLMALKPRIFSPANLSRSTVSFSVFEGLPTDYNLLLLLLLLLLLIVFQYNRICRYITKIISKVNC